ncbi:MAG: DegT/DnrJ/EryC1/StrS family aminotransferase [Planctomycetota bacterium]|nr:MAG: DegT/DnrJ/EryC1/StrS family aminotransferase [Planctomycetota bacterium]
MKIARYNYPDQFGDQLDAVVDDVRQMLVAGRYILSAEVSDFEQAFAGYVGTRFAKGVNSGTDALVLALAALGIGPGDEVITAANTFNATVAAIRLAGATPVLVDADEQSFLLDVKQLPAAITQRTKALLPVHLYGKPCPMGEIMRIAQSASLLVVEDAAQAHGAKVDGKRVGSFGQAGCFSFHPSKNLAAAGDAGMLVTSDEAVDQFCQKARSLGQEGQNNHVILGGNTKLDAIQARVLSAKLPRLDAWNAQRRQVAAAYRERLADLPLGCQSTSPDEEHVYHLFQVRTPRRDELLTYLKERGVDAVTRYPQPIHLQEAFAGCWKPGQFPVAEALCNELLCLPIRPDMGEDEIDYVATTVRSFFEGTA